VSHLPAMPPAFPASAPFEPSAERRSESRLVAGRELVDPFFWLRQRENPEVRAYLEAENAWTEQAMAETAALQDQIYSEMVGRLQEDDATVPVAIDDWLYYERTRKGDQFSIYCRRRGPEGEEQVLLDPNLLGQAFVTVGAFEVSRDHRLLAYSLDLKGDERFGLRIRDLETGLDLADAASDTAPLAAWSNDGRYLFYVALDATSRPYRVLRHHLGTPAEADVVIFEEPDERFFVAVSHCRSRRFLRITLDSHTTSEIHVLDADRPEEAPRLLVGRRSGIELKVDHHGDSFYLLTNDGALNFRLLRAPTDEAEPQWEEVVGHEESVELIGLDLFQEFLVLSHRTLGLRGLRICHLPTGAWHEVAFDEAVYTVKVDDNEDFASRSLRFLYSSPLTPPSVYDYDMATRERLLRKRTAVLGEFHPELYVTERLAAPTADGALVPMSLVYRRDLARDGANPTLLYGYGAYGASTEPRFSSARWSLLERGFVFAIAHIRGGGELGRGWYHAGKLEHKTRTFSDFEAAAEQLIARGFTSPRHLTIRGGSAGGMLIGAVLNRRPELFHAAIAEVPFVDVVNTMLDPSLPLTVIEYEEWGDPSAEGVLQRLLDYSPYDTVRPQAYPHLLVTGGLNDPRVMYWEPAKWVAKLRATRQDENLLLLRIDLGAGHGGAAGRYDALREEAFKYAFLLLALATPRRDRKS
jgi:oligopeptidase B